LDGIKERQRYGWIVTVIFFFTWGFIFLDRLAISFASNVLIENLNLTPIQFSSLTAISTLAFAVSSIVMGIISDKSGYRKRILFPFTLIAGILSFACSFAQDYSTILILRACVGFFEGPSMTLIMAILAHASFGGTFGRNAGIVGAGVAVLANTIGPILITRVVASYSWQYAFKVSGVLLVLASLVVAVIIREVKSDGVPTKQDRNEAPKSKASMSALFGNKNFVLCVLIGICCMVGYWTTMIFAPMYLTNVMELSTLDRGYVSTIMGAIFIVIQLFIPAFSDKVGRRPVMIYSFIACVLSPLSMWLAAGMFVSLAGYCVFGGIPGAMPTLFANVVPMESLPDELKTSAGGIILGLSEVLGGVIWPLFAGGIMNKMGGVDKVMMISAILLAICAVLCSFLNESNPKIIAARATK
jgi:MFS family permease